MKNRRKTFHKRLQILMGIVSLFVLAAILFTAPEAGLIMGASIALIPVWGSFKDSTFKELSAEEITKLEIDEQVAYFNELNLHKADQMTKLKAELKQQNTDTLNKEIAELREDIKKDTIKQLSTLHKALEAQGMAINKILDRNESVPSKKSIEDMLTENKEALLEAANKTVTFKTDVTKPSVVNSAWALDLPGFGQLAHLTTKILQIFAKGTVSAGQGGVVRYVDQQTVTRAADWTSESSVKPESAINWIVKTVPLETIADTIPITNQALRDIPLLASEIRNFLLTNLSLKIDSSLFNGDGVAPNITGIYTYADEYLAPQLGLQDANIYDLILLIKTNITKGSNYTPNIVLINPDDATRYMMLKKDSHNNYVLPPFVELRNGKMFISGMEVIETSSTPANQLVVGDSSKAVVYSIGGVKIDIGMIDKQFVENMLTVRAEQAMALVVRSVHQNAFNKETDIADALSELAT